VVALVLNEKNCTMHWDREMVLVLAKKLTSIFGITMDDIEVSTKAKLPRKRYMGM
jgi:hypothetical protein